MVEPGGIEDVVEEAGGVGHGRGAVDVVERAFVGGCAVVAEELAKVESFGGVVVVVVAIGGVEAGVVVWVGYVIVVPGRAVGRHGGKRRPRWRAGQEGQRAPSPWQ